MKKSWTDVVSNFKFKQIRMKLTRITGSEKTSTLIDQLYFNTNVNIKHSDVIQWSINDHFPVYAAIETDNNNKNKTNNKILRAYFRNCVTAMLRQNKLTYYNECVELCKDDPRKLREM